MTRLALFASLVAAGCLTSTSPTPSPTEDELLAMDTYYTGYRSTFASPAECLAQSSHPHGWDCAFELALCANGKASLRFGDIATNGTYLLDGDIARGMIDSEELAFDVASAAEPEEPILDGIRWQLDTEGRWKTEPFATNGCH